MKQNCQIIRERYPDLILEDEDPSKGGGAGTSITLFPFLATYCFLSASCFRH